MINCDFCSQSFHFDCCNPPLTAAPKERWMCPLHLEPILVRNIEDYEKKKIRKGRKMFFINCVLCPTFSYFRILEYGRFIWL